MINIEHQIKHWRDTSWEEWQVAQDLLAKKHVRQALFWAHLTLEKMLKAHVCKQTRDLAPRSHNLPRLGELAGLTLEPEQIKFLIGVNDFNIEGRYLEHLPETPTLNDAKRIMRQIGEFMTWPNEKL